MLRARRVSGNRRTRPAASHRAAPQAGIRTGSKAKRACVRMAALAVCGALALPSPRTALTLIPVPLPARTGAPTPAYLRNPVRNAPYPDLNCHGVSVWTLAAGWKIDVTGPCVMARTANGRRLVYNADATQRLMLEAIDSARRAEGLGPLALPVDFRRMTPYQQLFVLTDLERTSRGLPQIAGTTHALYVAAKEGALRNADPVLAGGDPFPGGPYGPWGSIWASSGLSNGLVLGAWFGWMYADGWNGNQTSNLTCTSPTASACWGHRDTILGHWGREPAAGAFADVQPAAAGSYTMIFTSGVGREWTPVLPRDWRGAPFSSKPYVLFP